MQRSKRTGWLALFFFLLMPTGTFYHSHQLDSLGKLTKLKIPGIKDLLKKKPVVTTDLSHAVTDLPFLDDFNPQNFRSLTALPRGDNGEFILDRPGLYELQVQSYCLHAGTYAPSSGDGYIYAPLKGRMADIVRHVIHRSFSHPQIQQKSVQLLLWAIQSHTKISRMTPQLQAVARTLLTPKEIFKINGGALGLIPQKYLRKMMTQLPPAVRRVMTAETRIRDMLSTGQATYREIERAAVLVGNPLPGEGSREIPAGRWSYHPDGFFVRFFPSGFPKTLIHLYRPEEIRLKQDQVGRITAIEDRWGNRIEVAYGERQEVHVFKSVRFVNHMVVLPDIEFDIAAEWQNRGWTLTGPAHEFSGLGQRRQQAEVYRKQLQDLDRQFGVLGEDELLMNLFHLKMALDELVKQDSTPTANWAPGHIDLVTKACLYRLCDRWGGITPETEVAAALPLWGRGPAGDMYEAQGAESAVRPTPVFDAAATVATPGNTNRQRLLVSGTPISAYDPCAEIKKVLKNQQALFDAFANQDLVNQAKDGKWDMDQYKYEVVKEAFGEDVANKYKDWNKNKDEKKKKDFVGMELDLNTGEINWGDDNLLDDLKGDHGDKAGEIIYYAMAAHEREHKRSYIDMNRRHKIEKKRNPEIEEEKLPPTFSDFVSTAEGLSQMEMEAYHVSITELKKALAELGCEK
jgi:hypothetical protein